MLMEANFNEDAITWLRKKGFKDEEIESARRSLSIVRKNLESGKETTVRLPKGTSGKVAALVYSVLLNTDVEGKPLGFQNSSLIDVTPGARKRFGEEVEIGEYEEVLEHIKKIKFGRSYSDPRRRTSVKKDE